MLLLVNDDGIEAKGLRTLHRALRQRTRQAVLTVAPQEAQSGRAHAITLDRGLSITPIHDRDFFAFAVDGTPTDCVKLALTVICTTRPRLVISGINEGPNVGRSLFYSGTVAAAMEAAVEGHAAVAVSRETDGGAVEEAASFAAELVAAALKRQDLTGRVLNINCPGLPQARWQPLRTCLHGLSGFQERYHPQRERSGRVSWHLRGTWHQRPDEDERDAAALHAGHPTASILHPDVNGLADQQDDAVLRRIGRAAELWRERQVGEEVA